MIDDAASFARRRPARFLVLAALTGFACGRLARSAKDSEASGKFYDAVLGGNGGNDVGFGDRGSCSDRQNDHRTALAISLCRREWISPFAATYSPRLNIWSEPR